MGEGFLDGEKETELDDSQYPHYLTRYTTGRNAQFFNLSRAEREHLGGVEYRAITLLAVIVPVYWGLWQLLGCLGLAAWFAYNKADVTLQNGINPWSVHIPSSIKDTLRPLRAITHNKQVVGYLQRCQRIQQFRNVVTRC